ncbi:MAG: PEP-CTERM sorting domain-containing protein [Gemmatimonas sp.]
MNWVITSRAAMLCAVIASSAGAQSGPLTMDTRNNLYLAGGNVVSAGFTGGGGLTPGAINLNAGTSRILTVSSATGSAFFCTSTCQGTLEGGAIGGTDIASGGVIAGIVAPSPASGFLAGLFLGPSLPAVAPARLNFNSGLNFTSLSPLVGQIFFIGNGLTSGMVTQQFLVPDGATRLYFGIADAGAFSGAPGFYDDNVGSYSFNYAVTGAQMSAVPEPSTVALFGIGALCTLAFARRRRGV